MNIYKISQNENNDYDTFDSMVVIAKDENEARIMCPSFDSSDYIKYDFTSGFGNSEWASKLENVTVEYIGKAKKNEVARIVLASYNAG